MSHIEFETVISKGTIEVPKEHVHKIHGRVRVIIITPEEDEDIDMIEYLMQHPLRPVTHDAKLLSREEAHERRA